MTWQGIQGHDAVVERFRRAARRGRLAGSFLFVGPSGVGKRHLAIALAKGLLCKGSLCEGTDREAGSIDPCGRCESCRLFGSEEIGLQLFEDGFDSPHPDLYLVSRPAGKTELPLDLLIGDKEHRGRSGLCYNIFRTPFFGHRKVAVIDDADFLNAEGANAMLKTLEEPPPDSVLILVGTSSAKQLPTIRSRCQIVRFAPLPTRTLASLLEKLEIVATPQQGHDLARRAGGSLDQARELIDDAVDEIRGLLNKNLSVAKSDAVSLAAQLNEFVEQAGKEAPKRRRRLRLLLNFAVDLFREKLKKFEKPVPDEQTALVREHHEDGARRTAKHLEYTLDALDQIDRNVNLPSIIDAWCLKVAF